MIIPVKFRRFVYYTLFSFLIVEFLYRALTQGGLKRTILFFLGTLVAALWLKRQFFYALLITGISYSVSTTLLNMPLNWLKLMDLLTLPYKSELYQTAAFQQSRFIYQGPTLGPVGTFGLLLLILDVFRTPLRSNHGLAFGLIFLCAPTGLPMPAPLVMGALSLVVRHRMMTFTSNQLIKP